MAPRAKRTLLAFSLVLACALWSTPRADAALIFAASGGVAGDFCAVDNDAFACTFGTQLPDTDPTLGSLGLANFNAGGLIVNGSLHTQTLAPPLNILSSSSLSIVNPTGAP